jgi:hypothetical protein
VGVNETSITAQLESESGDTARIALLARGASGQTANVFVVENFGLADLLAVSASGRVGIQSTAEPLTADTYATASTTGAVLALRKSRNANIGTQGVVVNGDLVGGVIVYGSDGSSFQPMASVTVEVDGGASAGDVPARMLFGTTADGAAAITERMRLDSRGRLGIGVTPSDANSILGLSKGINFPSTAVASTNANTLDDYEEGTWTPALTFATAGDLSITYTLQSARYTRIGRFVQVEGRVTTNAMSYTTASGSLRMSGLPFTVNAGGTSGGGNAIVKGHTATITGQCARPTASTDYCDFPYVNGTAALGTLGTSNIASGAVIDILFNFGYTV